MAKSAIRGLVLLLLAALPPAARAQQPVKAVPQVSPGYGVDVAAWVQGGKFLLTANSETRTLQLWAVGPAYLVDSIDLPLDAADAQEELLLNKLEVWEDGRRAELDAVVRGLDDKRTGRRYTIDLVRRTTTVSVLLQSPELQGAEGMGAGMRIAALKNVEWRPSPGTAKESDDDVFAARQAWLADNFHLPKLPTSPDGRLNLKRDAGGLSIVEGTVGRGGRSVAYDNDNDRMLFDAGQGKIRSRLVARRETPMRWAAPSPDGRWVGFLDHFGDPTYDFGILATKVSEFVLFDVERGRFLEPQALQHAYGRVGWLDADSLLVSITSQPIDRFIPARSLVGAPAVGMVLDAWSGETRFEVQPRCYMQPAGPGVIVGAGLASCRRKAGTDHALARWTAETGWVAFGTAETGNEPIDALRASSDGRYVAVATAKAILVLETSGGRLVARLPIEVAVDPNIPISVSSLAFAADNSAVVFVMKGAGYLWRPGDPVATRLALDLSAPTMLVSDGRSVLFSDAVSNTVGRVGTDGGPALPPLELAQIVNGGFLSPPPSRTAAPQRDPLFWAVSARGTLHFVDSRSWKTLASVSRFQDEQGRYFLAAAPDGRYDTDVPPDSSLFRWQFADTPFGSYEPQTLMRDYYTPGLLATLLECAPARRCGERLPSLPSVAGINRALPAVEFGAITPGPRRGEASVEVIARAQATGLVSDAYSGRTSGLHNLRLFRDGRLVAQAGVADPNLDSADRETWRTQSRLAPNQPDGSYRHLFERVKLPARAGAEVALSAYAFNDDRVKGSTASAGLTTPRGARSLPPRRLYLLSIGINAYPGGVFRPLRYAVPDARAFRETLAAARPAKGDGRGFEVVPIEVLGTAEAPATRAALQAAFARLKAATPDDLVLVTFSGHGYTDPQGRFALVPSDVRTEGDVPVRESLVTAGDLSAWLAEVDAGDITLVIDACHSAASVAQRDFKPGPLGDPGLGQLAYDKGMRILAASQPDQFAMEETSLGHGLLTYAMMEEGARRKQADYDRNGQISLDELIVHAQLALPRLADPARLETEDGPGLLVEWDAPPPGRQRPAFFNFKRVDPANDVQLVLAGPR